MKTSNYTTAPRDNSRGAGSSHALSNEMLTGLPSASCAKRYELPTPNIETLKNILRWHGCPNRFVEGVAEGYAPREFQFGMTGLWKVRDAFYYVVLDSVHCFTLKMPPRLTLRRILGRIVETAGPYNLFLHELLDAADSVRWEQCACSTGTFGWPTPVPSCSMSWDLLTATRLCVLHTIWSTNPEDLLAVDFSAGVADFLNENCDHIKKLIADAIQSRPALPESTARCDAEITVEAGESALTTEVQRLLDVLQDGPKSRQEL